MYIVTLEERDVQNQDWYKTYRSFVAEHNARDFMECMYECGEAVRNIQVWEADLIPHAVSCTAEVKFLVE